MRDMQERQADHLLINVLHEDAFRDQHIPDSINIPLDTPDFAKELEKKAGGKDRQIVVYCASTDCNASAKAARRLDEAGFTQVFDFEPGLQGWVDADLPIQSLTGTGAQRNR
jgi:rhodanese-related sulfurtransferase